MLCRRFTCPFKTSLPRKRHRRWFLVPRSKRSTFGSLWKKVCVCEEPLKEPSHQKTIQFNLRLLPGTSALCKYSLNLKRRSLTLKLFVKENKQTILRKAFVEPKVVLLWHRAKNVLKPKVKPQPETNPDLKPPSNTHQAVSDVKAFHQFLKNSAYLNGWDSNMKFKQSQSERFGVKCSILTKDVYRGGRLKPMSEDLLSYNLLK